jgi:hypothetical protein
MAFVNPFLSGLEVSLLITIDPLKIDQAAREKAPDRIYDVISNTETP